VLQAKAVLWAGDGVADQEIARRCQVTPDAVRRWRTRFAEQGVDGVGKIAKGRGRKSPLTEGTVAEIVRVSCQDKPDDGGTHWTTRLLAKRFGLGKDTIAKVWADYNLKPWKVSTFKISNAPQFEVKLVDVVGLYLNPPKRAVVFSFDEKTQCQAIDRTQPSLPMVPGRAGTMTHDDQRNGTTDLFAAMNVATGEVLTHCQKGHTAEDVLRFFKQIDATVPRGLAVHVVLDNLSAHKAPEITKWLAHKDRRRWHLHFTPTSSYTRRPPPRPVTTARGSRRAPPERPPPGLALPILCPHRLSAAAATTVQNSAPLTPVPRCTRTLLPASAPKVDLMASLGAESSRQLIVDTQQALASSRLAVATSWARLSHTTPVLQPAPPGNQARPVGLDPCLELEAVIDRVARLVIHAQALADRTAALPVIVEAADRHRRANRLHLLRAAVDLGQRAITAAVTTT